MSDERPAAVWDPATYLRHAGERARPFAELLSRVDAAAPARVVDLGCGEGTATASLLARWPDARVTGVDSSPEMLAAAASVAVPGRLEFVQGDVRTWEPDGHRSTSSSATRCCTGCPGHADADCPVGGWLSPGGWLAVQVPGNFRAPTHALLAELCRSPRWADRLADAAPRPDAVLEPVGLPRRADRGRAAADVWETTYLHVLTGEDPVLGWVHGTVLRPVLAGLDDDEAAAFTAEYAAALRSAYPRRDDGTTVLPFRRIFAVGQRRELSRS